MHVSRLAPLLFAALLLSPGCKSSGATEGAARGAAVGALSSGIVGAVFGGDVGKSMAYGAVGGAVTGGLSGAASDNQASAREQQQALATENAKLQQQNRALQLRQDLIARIGVDNTEAIAALVDCRHDEAQQRVDVAARAGDPDHELAALWIEAVIALDRRDTAAARALYPDLVERDEDATDIAAAEATALDLLSKLEDTRAEFGRARRCD